MTTQMRPHHARIQPGMRVRHTLVGQYGIVQELGRIGKEAGALVQWLDRNERRDGRPDWALLCNLCGG